MTLPNVETRFDPTYVPPRGVHISSNARVILGNVAIPDMVDSSEEYELIRCQRAVVRFSNNVGFYLETGKQSGILYAGPFDVSGSLTRSYINRLEHKLVVGTEDYVEDGVQLSDFVPQDDEEKFSSAWGRVDLNRYAPNNLVVELELDSDSLGFGPVRLRVHKVLFGTAAIAFDANNLIRSGPLDFIGSWVSIHKF